jgi:hypothetical protein
MARSPDRLPRCREGVPDSPSKDKRFPAERKVRPSPPRGDRLPPSAHRGAVRQRKISDVPSGRSAQEASIPPDRIKRSQPESNFPPRTGGRRDQKWGSRPRPRVRRFAPPRSEPARPVRGAASLPARLPADGSRAAGGGSPSPRIGRPRVGPGRARIGGSSRAADRARSSKIKRATCFFRIKRHNTQWWGMVRGLSGNSVARNNEVGPRPLCLSICIEVSGAWSHASNNGAQYSNDDTPQCSCPSPPEEAMVVSMQAIYHSTTDSRNDSWIVDAASG